MKKKIILITLMLIFSCFSISLSAEDIIKTDNILNYQKLAESSEYSEISNLTDEIVDGANGFYERNLAQFPRKVTAKDIDYSKAVKIYGIWDTSYLYTNSKQDLLSGLEKDGYVWELPININGKIIIAGISKIKLITEEKEHLLSEEQLEKNKKEAGQWHTTSWNLEPSCTDYIVKINSAIASSKRNNIKKSDVVFAVGYPGIGTISALVMSEDTVDYLVPVFKPSTVKIQNKNSIESSAVQKFNSQISDSSIFAYSDVIELLKAIPAEKATGELSAGAAGIQMDKPLRKNSKYVFLFGSIGIFLLFGICIKVNHRCQK